MLYQHPNDWLIGRYLRDALSISKKLDREQELLKGFRHFLEIPFESELRPVIARALAEHESLASWTGDKNDDSSQP
ncbi:MAG: hypothetical protein AB9869_34675 [Verrucomicrobiia bacterium]